MALSKKATALAKYLAMGNVDPKTLLDRKAGTVKSPNENYKNNTGVGLGKRVFTAFRGAMATLLNEILAVSPSITSFSPITAVATGATVTITGLRFTGTTSVKFGKVAATSFTVVSATSITVVVPAKATSGSVRVSSPTGFSNKSGFIKA